MASKRNKRRKSCEGKHRYATQDEAETGRQKLLKKGEFKLSAYKCKFCNGWHVGHMPKEMYTGMIEKRMYGNK